jgi:ABC-type phosphate/phosphonate transport system substrate-binding protein
MSMRVIAHLPMYDFPELRPATDALWQAVAERLRRAGVTDVPDFLSHDLTHHESWAQPHLMLGQSCGFPAMTDFADQLRIVAAAIYNAPGCADATHCSFIVVPAASSARELKDLRGSRFALNAWDSNTGMNLPRLAFAPFAESGRFFSAIVVTGSHAASLASLAEGRADIAAIDCVSHALLLRLRPELGAATRILARTQSGPSLPFVTARGNSEDLDGMLRSALTDALADPALAATREALLLDGIVAASAADYDILVRYRDAARQFAYPVLA